MSGHETRISEIKDGDDNPFATPTDVGRSAGYRSSMTITRRCLLVGVAAGFGYTIILGVLSFRQFYTSDLSRNEIEKRPDWVLLLIEVFVAGAGMSVVLGIIGAAIGAILEIVVSVFYSDQATNSTLSEHE